MNKKLFVGGISWGVDDDELRRHFEQYGVVQDSKVIRDRETGRSRGFGFVTFESAEDAATAKRELDGSEHQGRTIRVNEAEQRRSQRQSSYGGWQGRNGNSGGSRYSRYRDRT